jgi:hypothetical protein
MFDGITTEQEPEKLSSFLERAMHLIEDPRHWCQRDFNRISNGVWQYCALGALDYTAGGVRHLHGQIGVRAELALNSAAAQMGFAANAGLLNDLKDHGAVMDMYSIAIAAAKAREVKLE